MTYFNLTEYLETKKRVIDRALNKYLPAGKKETSLVQQTMRYAVFPGGKRLRPILTIAACEACGGKIKDVLPVACAIELIHNYSLIHDDLPAIDNDDFRRGKPACHRKFGEAIALLAGDALLAKAFEILSGVPRQAEREIARSVGIEGLIGGEAEEIMLGHRLSVIGNRSIVKNLYLKKTGALIRAAVVCGGMVADASRRQLGALRSYGDKFGLAFQISDDILDYDRDKRMNWVSLFGLGRAKKDVSLLVSQAKNAVKYFGRQAEILEGLADLIKRRH